jgi:peptidoglycan-N-acetylglucosamine deacetylase
MAAVSPRRVVKAMVQSMVPARYLVWSGDPSSRRVALTFDDGPNPEHTPRVAGLLRELNVRATFFVVGRNVEAHPALVAELMADGHELGNHTYSHVNLHQVGRQRGGEELRRTDALLRAVDRRYLGLFRPPWGQLGVSGALYALASGNPAVMWSLDSLDYHRDATSRIVERVAGAEVSGGAILLFHDDNRYTSEALPVVIEDLKRRGLGFCTVSEMLRGGA